MNPEIDDVGNPAPEEMRALLEAFRVPTVLLRPDYRVVAANGAYREHYGDGRCLSDAYCYQVSHGYEMPCDRAGEHCPLRRTLDTGARQRVLHVHHTPRGDEHVDIEMIPIHDASGNIAYLLEHLHEAPAASVDPGAQGMVGRSPAFNRMVELIHRVAPTGTAVLLLGESGTGKELAARALHEDSACRDGPFVPVECSGLTETLFESELFGHERGAFTGAVSRKPGLVDAARGGTLFLDEVGDIPLAQQVKLLRLIETRTYRPVGSVEPRQADFRLVCATHRHLRELVAAGQFREDLFYRISAFPIRLPPLRERLEDLPLLVESILRRIAGPRRVRLTPAAEARLLRYRFPGNVRELRNLLEYSLLLADDDLIDAEHLPMECREPDPPDPAAGPPPEPEAPGAVIPLAEVERRYLQRVVARHGGDRRALARELGVSERTLYRKLERLGPR